MVRQETADYPVLKCGRVYTFAARRAECKSLWGNETGKPYTSTESASAGDTRNCDLSFATFATLAVKRFALQSTSHARAIDNV